MDAPKPAESNLTFILRVWREPGPDGESRWRGEILHSASGQRRGFVDLTAAAEFVHRWTDASVLAIRVRRDETANGRP